MPSPEVHLQDEAMTLFQILILIAQILGSGAAMWTAIYLTKIHRDMFRQVQRVPSPPRIRLPGQREGEG